MHLRRTCSVLALRLEVLFFLSTVLSGARALVRTLTNVHCNAKLTSCPHYVCTPCKSRIRPAVIYARQPNLHYASHTRASIHPSQPPPSNRTRPTPPFFGRTVPPKSAALRMLRTWPFHVPPGVALSEGIGAWAQGRKGAWTTTAQHPSAIHSSFARPQLLRVPLYEAWSHTLSHSAD